MFFILGNNVFYIQVEGEKHSFHVCCHTIHMLKNFLRRNFHTTKVWSIFQNMWHNFTMKREVNIHTEFILLYFTRHVSKHAFECQEWNSILREACNATKLLKNWHTSYIHEDRQGTYIKPTLSEQYSKASTLFYISYPQGKCNFLQFFTYTKSATNFQFFSFNLFESKCIWYSSCNFTFESGLSWGHKEFIYREVIPHQKSKSKDYSYYYLTKSFPSVNNQL